MRKGVVNILYIFFILFLALIVIIGFAYIPSDALDESIRVASLDAAIMNHRIKNKISSKDALTLRDYPLQIKSKKDISNNLDDYVLLSNKNAAYKINIDDKELIFNPGLLATGRISAPVGGYFDIFYRKNIFCDKTVCANLLIEQVLPEVYDVK